MVHAEKHEWEEQRRRGKEEGRLSRAGASGRGGKKGERRKGKQLPFCAALVADYDPQGTAADKEGTIQLRY